MKIQHNIDRFKNIEDTRFKLCFSDMTSTEYENIRCLILAILKYGQFNNDTHQLVREAQLTQAFQGLTIYDSEQTLNYEI